MSLASYMRIESNWKNSGWELSGKLTLSDDISELSKFLTINFDLTYVSSGTPYVLTDTEFRKILRKKSYELGSNGDSYLYPINIRVLIETPIH